MALGEAGAVPAVPPDVGEDVVAEFYGDLRSGPKSELRFE